MRYVTYCPSCGTAFKIVDDQLRIAQGWVRCGHCQAVYKAEETLSVLTEAGPAAKQRSTSSSPSVAPTTPTPGKPNAVSAHSHQLPKPSSTEQPQPRAAAATPAKADATTSPKPADHTTVATNDMLARIAAIVAAKKAALQQAENTEKAIPSSASNKANNTADSVHATKTNASATSTAQDRLHTNTTNAAHASVVTTSTDEADVPGIPAPFPAAAPQPAAEAADGAPAEVLKKPSEEKPAPKDTALPPALPAPDHAAVTPAKEAESTKAAADAELQAEAPATTSSQPGPVDSAPNVAPPELPAPAKPIPVTPIPATPSALPAIIPASVASHRPGKTVEQPSNKAADQANAADTPAPSSSELPATASASVVASASTQETEDTAKPAEQEAEMDAEAQRRRRALREQRQQRLKNKEGSRSRKRVAASATVRDQPSTWQTLWTTLRRPFQASQTEPPPQKQAVETPAASASVSSTASDVAASTLPAPTEVPDAATTPQTTAAVIQTAETAPTETATAETATTPETEENFAFMRDAQRRAFWQQPKIRASLLAGIALGMLTLAAQWAYAQRSELAARIPLARATFNALRIDVPPWQNIQAIDIQDSDFLLNPDNSYQLHISLRNNSNHPTAMPALELALLDDDEQLVVKRVITSDPALPMPTAIPPRGQWDATTEVVVQLPPSLAQRGIAGYRVAIFYP